jgi:uncharacterized protein (DUF924 family)
MHGDSMMESGFEEVLQFWFPPNLDSGDSATLARRFEWWFRGGANAAIAERYAEVLNRAERGELDAWSADPRSRLALILVLDQFPRSLYPNSAKAYAQDPRALALALEGIRIGHYAALERPWEKTFFFLPLGHSESLVHLETAVAMAEAIVPDVPAALRPLFEHSVSQARGHRDVVARFGRQPHRNAILGRASTDDELAYLAKGELVHQRSLPAELLAQKRTDPP